MAHKDRLKRYQITYARLLNLYPRTYRTQFAEPMLQMFADLCNEHLRTGKDMLPFLLRTYAETFANVAKERANDMSTSLRTNRSKIIIGVGGLGLLSVASIFMLFNNNPNPAQSISPLSSLERVRQLSKGKKETCLANNQHAMDSVRSDDDAVGESSKFSKFDLAASSGIYDVPAGTSYELTINTYENSVATGSLEYEQSYGTYNYVIKKLADVRQWEFVSMTACEK